MTALLIIALGVTAALSFGYYLLNKPKNSIASQKADFTMEPAKLLAEFESSEEDANRTYLDKIVMVNGTISSISEDKGHKTIALDTGNPMSNVSCELSAKESLKKLSYNEGDRISLKGICTGMLMDVVLVDCVVLTNLNKSK